MPAGHGLGACRTWTGCLQDMDWVPAGHGLGACRTWTGCLQLSNAAWRESLNHNGHSGGRRISSDFLQTSTVCGTTMTTVKPLQNDHPLVQRNVVVVDRWLLFAVHFLCKIDCLCTKKRLLEAGDRYSRWSLKAARFHCTFDSNKVTPVT